MQPQELCNRVCLCGTVDETPQSSHVLYGEVFYTFPLRIARLSGADDVVPVTAGGRLFARPGAADAQLPPLPCQGQRVRISGQLRSYNMHQDAASRLLITAFARHMAYAEPEAACENEVLLSGFLCKPVTYRTTPFSREIADMLLAVNRAYRKSDYLPLIAWGRNARFAASLQVGDCICVSGRLQSRAYQKRTETGAVIQRMAYEVSVATLRLI